MSIVNDTLIEHGADSYEVEILTDEELASLLLAMFNGKFDDGYEAGYQQGLCDGRRKDR